MSRDRTLALYSPLRGKCLLKQGEKGIVLALSTLRFHPLTG